MDPPAHLVPLVPQATPASVSAGPSPASLQDPTAGCVDPLPRSLSVAAPLYWQARGPLGRTAGGRGSTSSPALGSSVAQRRRALSLARG